MKYWVYPAIPAAVLGFSGLISYLFKIGLKKKTKEENVAEQKKKYRTRAKRKFKQKKKSLKTIIKKKSNANKKNKVTFQNPVVKYAKQLKPSINFSNDKTDGNVNAQKKTANVQPYNVNFTTSNSNEEASDISDLSDFPNENEEPENVILIPVVMQLPRTEIQNFVDSVKNRTIEFIEKSNLFMKNIICPRCAYLPETHLKSEEIQSNVFFQKFKNVQKFTGALHSTLYLENHDNNSSVLTREELEVYQRITSMRHIFDYWDSSAKVKMPHLMEFANENKEPENVILLIPLIMQLSRTEVQNFVDELNDGKEFVGPLFETPPKSEEVQSNMFLPNFRNAYGLLLKLDFFMKDHISSMPFTKVTVLSREQLEVYRQMTPMRKRNILDYWDPLAEEFVTSSETINYSKQMF